MFHQTVDADGNFDINFAEGVEQFENKVLFITGACQQLIGTEFQSRQMKLFPSKENVVLQMTARSPLPFNPLVNTLGV